MSTDTFQIICGACGSKLKAKSSQIGKTYNCPKCKNPVLIREEIVLGVAVEQTDSITPIIQIDPFMAPPQYGPTLGDGTGEITASLPQRLQFQNKYVMIGSERIVALWEGSKGWQINVGSGFTPAKMNIAAIPDQGTFALVELVIGANNEELAQTGGPKKLNVFMVSCRGALTALYRDENEILQKIDGVCDLAKPQKHALMTYLRQNFMQDSLTGAGEILEYLANG